MANNPFDRITFGLRERPVSADFNRGFSQADRTLRDLLATMFSARSLTSALGVPYTGFFGDGFRCVPTSPIGMSVQLQAGLGFYYTTEDVPFNIGLSDLEAVDDRSNYKPMFLIAPQTFAVPAAPSAGNSRIDIIEVKYNRQLTDADTRRQLDVSTVKFMDHVFFKGLSFQLDTQTGIVNDPSPSTAPMGYKIGVVAPTGDEIEPKASPGYVKVARISVGPAVTTIDQNVLSDLRSLLYPGGLVPFGGTWRLQWNAGSPIVTCYSITAPAGLHVNLAPSGIDKGSGTINVVGGRITGGSMTISGQYPTASGGVGLCLQNTPFLTGVVFNVSSQQAALLAGTPSINVDVGSQLFQGSFASRFLTATGSNNATDISLEDIMIQVSGSVRYA